MCKGVIRVVDAKYSPTLSVQSFTGIDFSFSLSLSNLHALQARNPRNGETGGNLVKSWVIPLSWDFLVCTLTHPSKELHIATLFRAPVNDVGDKFGSAPVGRGFPRTGIRSVGLTPKGRGRPYHVCTGVIRFVDAKVSPNLSVRSFTGIDFSLSLSLSNLHALLAQNSRNGETGGNLVN